MNHIHSSRQRGFTLIELLVVVAIIALLASIILASLNSARVKGRDARRIADLKEILNAVELVGGANALPLNSQLLACSSSITSVLVPNYISSMPMDPNIPTCVYNNYLYYGSSYGVDLMTVMEGGSTAGNWCYITDGNGYPWAGSYPACPE